MYHPPVIIEHELTLLDRAQIAMIENASQKEAKSDDFINLPKSPAVCQCILKDGDEYFESLVRGIELAKACILLETYIFKLDLLGLKIINALSAAAERGVQVRVLMDGIGSAEDGQHIALLLEQAGVSTKIYHPLPWQVRHYHRAINQGSLLGQVLFFFQKINQRDHRKLCVIDRENLWMGSLNICTDHLSLEKGGAGWRDLGLKMSGPGVSQAEDSFNRLWQAHNKPITHRSYRHILSNLTPKAQRKKVQFITQKIRLARSRIWLASAYFAPSSKLIKALKNAAANGLDVRLILPRNSDVKIFPYLSATYYPELLQSGVHIHEYKSGFLHTKALIIDQTYLLGSTNFNHRSFIHDLELDVFVTQTEAQQDLEQIFKQDLSQAKPITLPAPSRALGARLLGWLAKLLRYWF